MKKKSGAVDVNRITGSAEDTSRGKVVGKQAKAAQNEIKKALAGKNTKKKR